MSRSESHRDGRRARRSVLFGVYAATLAVGAIAVSSPSWATPNPTISLNKTVGTDASVCATTDVITVPAGAKVVFCYTATNDSGFTYSVHDLVDSELGPILTSFQHPLPPGSAVFLTYTAHPTATVTNTATWTAGIGFITQTVGLSESIISPAVGVDTATVVVADDLLELVKTVGTDPKSCASTDHIYVDAGTEVTYCYSVTNNYPDSTFSIHDLTDSELGSMLSAFAYDLGPGDSVFITQAATITDSVTNTATWTAWITESVPDGGLTEGEGSVYVEALDSAIVEVTTTTTTTTTVPQSTTTVPQSTTTMPQITTTTATGVLPATGGGGSGVTLSLLLVATGGVLLALGRRKRLAH